MLQDFQKEKLLHLFDILDFNHDGLLQKDDLESLAKNIHMFIMTHSHDDLHGSLEKDIEMIWKEIQGFFENPSFLYMRRAQWLEFMAHKFDTNNVRETLKRIDMAISWLTHVFDQGSDGKLSKLEFITIFVSLRIPAKNAEECFDKFDINGDGYISESELAKATKHFFVNDRDRDESNPLWGLLGTTHFNVRKSHSRRF